MILYAILADLLSGGDWAPIAIGGVIIVTVVAAGWTLLTGQSEARSSVPEAVVEDPPPDAPAAEPAGEAPVAHDPFIHGSATEKRVAIRRKGKQTPIVISDENAQANPYPAHIQDRSMQGLRIEVPRRIEPGTILSVRPSSAGDRVPWTQVQVRSCQKGEGSCWELGCQYVRTPPYSVLMLFG